MTPRPPHHTKRCTAIIYREGWGFTGSRCPQKRAAGSDLCKRHHDIELWGRLVIRVRPPRVVL